MFMKKDSIESSKFQVSTILALGLSILRFFFASSDSNLYNSIATAIDPDASSSCIAKLPTYLLACPPRDQKRFRTHTNIFSTKFQFHEK